MASSRTISQRRRTNGYGVLFRLLGPKKTMFLLLYMLLVHPISSFNVDLETRMIYHPGPSESSDAMFGYAVDLYSSRTGDYLLVGAPKAETSEHQPGVRKGGLIYKCWQAGSNAFCDPVIADRKGHTLRLNGSVQLAIDSKSYQMFGATLRTDKKSDRVVACAPHYKYFHSTFDKIDPVGSCYMAESLESRWQEFSPCRVERLSNYHRLGVAMCGFSATLPEEQDKMYLGGPGAWYWQGTAIVQSTLERNDVNRTGSDGRSWVDNHYMGYAIASGNFGGHADGLAVGSPRGGKEKAEFPGRVSLFTSRLRAILNISGDQPGSYFGAALAVLDVNGDGIVDIVIGAPLFSFHDRTQDGVVKTKYEVGRVSVYYQSEAHQFSGEHDDIDGEEEWARFGHSVAAAGDLNLDGAEDFIVGAPYAGEDRSGAVFVFNGKKATADSRGGVHKKPSQVILAEDVDNRLTSFGWSLAGNKDLDRNGYDDIAVGAYRSEKAILFKSRPIVTLVGAIEVYPTVVDLSVSSITKRSNTKGSEVSLKMCMTLGGKNHQESSVMVKSLIKLDTNVLAHRVNFTSPVEQPSPMKDEMRVTTDRHSCKTYYFIVFSNVRDKLSAIDIEATFELISSGPPSNTPRPVLDFYGTTKLMSKVDIKKDCGEDNICKPDLSITDLFFETCQGTGKFESCQKADAFNVGVDDYIKIIAKVVNRDEDAYNAQLKFTIPEGLEFITYEDKTEEFLVLCSDEVKNQVECELGNPLVAGVDLNLEFTISLIDFRIKDPIVTIELNSTNPDPGDKLSNNYKELVVPLDQDPNLRLFTHATSEVEFSSSDYRKDIVFVDEIGPIVSHTYEIRNDGSADLSDIALDIFWPAKTASGDHLLYVATDAVVTEGIGNCDTLQRRNPDNLGLPPDRFARDTRALRQADANPTPILHASFKSLVDKIRKLNSELRGPVGFNKLNVNCTKLNCIQFRCNVGPITRGGHVVVNVNSFLYVNTLIDQGVYEADITSVGIAEVKSLPYSPTKPPIVTEIATTKVISRDPIRRADEVPWWIWLIAALAGLAFLLLIALLLWKLGFFKRNRPPREKALLAKPPESEYYGYPTYGTHL